MSILASLARAYERLPDAPPFGFSSEKIGFLISLQADGSVASVTDLRHGDGKRKQPRMMDVPQPVKRTAGIAPNFLWDKTSYVLGVTAGEGKRTAEEHGEFVKRHVEALAGSEDEGLKALELFLRQWTPDQFAPPVWPEEMKDQNVVFCLEPDRLGDVMLHDRPAARALWARLAAEGNASNEVCLVTGEAGPVARLHPSIKGVWGAQSSGAALVSFNLDAFESYGHSQGDNAPVSEAAAFAYTTALNRFLERDSGHRVQIGDASTVFWADASEAGLAEEAESLFLKSLDSSEDDKAAATKVGVKLAQIRAGRPLAEIEPKLAHGVRFTVLGLAPNAARLSIRYYFEDDFGVLTKNYQRFVEDMRLEPGPRGFPSLGQRVNKGEVLAWVVPSAGMIERSNQSAQLAELRATKGLAEKRLTRLKELADTIPRKEIEAAESEVDSLNGRIAALGAGLSNRDALVAPVTGVVAMSNAVAGQVVEAREAVFEVVDPNRSRVEALAYDTAQALDVVSGSLAVGDARVPLAFVGAARSLREQALPLMFRGEGNALANLALGQPVKVFALTRSTVQGYRVPAAALVKNPANQAIVWVKTAPERFEPRTVTVEPLDGANVAVTTGLKAGDRVVVRGATLVNQVR